MLDLITLVIITITVVIAFMRGFIKETFGVIGILLSFVLTYYNYDFFSGFIDIKSQFLANIISTSTIYIISIISITVVNSGAMYLLRSLRLGSADRICGIIIGMFKGMIFSFLFFMFAKLIYSTLSTNVDNKDIDEILPKWIIESRVYEPLSYIEDNIDQILPEHTYSMMESFGTSLNNILNHKTTKNTLGKNAIDHDPGNNTFDHNAKKYKKRNKPKPQNNNDSKI